MMNGSPFGAHSDVLDAPVPVDDDKAKERLFQELKTRGRGAVQVSCWPDAVKLYTKALECSTASSELAIVQANIALCQSKMNHWTEACSAAEQAVVLDPTYTKGWWRLGQAQSSMGLYDKAVSAMKKAQALEPNNKALLKELTALQIKQQEAAEKKALQEMLAKQELSDQPTTTTTTTTTTTIVVKEEKPKPAAKTDTATGDAAEPMQVDVEDVAFSKSEPVKGYKIVNGKKTSYFHNELSQEAAALIGDIAPKKLEVVPEPTTTATATASSDTSVWNTAGTWEERDVTTWALDSLKQALMGCKYTLPDSSPAPGAVVSTKLATVTGHASVATVRGKKRYIYECLVKLEWQFEDDKSANAVHAHGLINFPDVDGTCGAGEYDAVGFVVQHCDVPTAQPLLEQFVHKQGWRLSIHQTIDDWVRLFKETY